MTLLRIRKNALALSLTTLASAILMLNCGVQDIGPSAENGPPEEVIDLSVSQGKADNIWGVEQWSLRRYEGRIDIIGTGQDACEASESTDLDCPKPLFEGQLRYLGPGNGLVLDYITRTAGELKDGRVLFDKDLNIISDIDKDSGLEILTVLKRELEMRYSNGVFKSCVVAMAFATVLGIIAVYSAGSLAAAVGGEVIVLAGDIAACFGASSYTASNTGDNDPDPAQSFDAPPVE